MTCTVRAWTRRRSLPISGTAASASGSTPPICGTCTATTVAYHKDSGLPQVPYSSQANGFFAKPLDEACRKLPQYDTPENRARWRAVQRIAGELKVTPNQVALAWILQHPQGGFAIIGP